MSILKRNAIDNIRRLISDEILREQMIDLHLGKLTPEDVKRIREEREQEAELILQMFPKQIEPPKENEPPFSHPITNGEPENRND
jgi:hypothetical protein